MWKKSEGKRKRTSVQGGKMLVSSIACMFSSQFFPAQNKKSAFAENP